MGFLESLNDAAAAATCQLLGNQGASSLLWAGVGAALTTPTPIGLVAGGVGALGLLALQNGCQFDPNTGGPGPDPYYNGCLEVTGGYMSIVWSNSFGAANSVGDVNRITNIEFVRKGTDSISEYELINVHGVRRGTEAFTQPVTVRPGHKTDITYASGATCIRSTTGVPQTPDTITYIDPVTNCTFNVAFQNWYVSGDGQVEPVYKITSGGQATKSGEIVGGCNFPPIVYKPPGGGGKPPWIRPWEDLPDDDDENPWWKELLEEAAAELTLAAIQALMRNLFGPKVPADVYRLVSVCEVDGEGEPVSQVREVSIPELEPMAAVIQRLDALEVLMQGLKDFKQPICETVEPDYTGRVVNVRFKSEQPSPISDRSLRKDFSYRDPSGKDLGLHRDHWKDFTWKSGSWMVMSKGAVWGKPQVWAETAEEGKRVLRHAAAIAGVDLQASRHRFVAREVANGRYGPVLSMKVRKDPDGDPWITERTGPSGPPSLSIDLPATLGSYVDNGSQQS